MKVGEIQCFLFNLGLVTENDRLHVQMHVQTVCTKCMYKMHVKMHVQTECITCMYKMDV